MKIHAALLASLALALLPVKSFAQLDERKPGIYAVRGGESVQLPYGYGLYSGFGVGPASFLRYHYDGESSGVAADSTFVLVVDPKKKVGSVTPKKFDCFTRNLTPEDIVFLPLDVNEERQCREYDPGVVIGYSAGPVTVAANAAIQERAGFEWEMISDNSFKITVHGLNPGEYGIAFRLSKLASFNYNAIFGFKVPEPEPAPVPEQEATEPAITEPAAQEPAPTN